tara:strand:- start:718 stop:1107 length:390 start_codon:yes stop_codon:yes gene_type:complete
MADGNIVNVSDARSVLAMCAILKTKVIINNNTMNNIKTNDETYIAAKAILEGQMLEASGGVFVVSGLTDYEGGQVLGVYSTKQAAAAALDAYKAQSADDTKTRSYNNREFDEYEIEEKSLNAPAAQHFS